MRPLVILLSLVMSACSSSSVGVPAPTYVLPSAPTDHQALVNGAKSAAGKQSLLPPLKCRLFVQQIVVSAVISLVSEGPTHRRADAIPT
jgi:hypothetical protein